MHLTDETTTWVCVAQAEHITGLTNLHHAERRPAIRERKTVIDGRSRLLLNLADCYHVAATRGQPRRERWLSLHEAHELTGRSTSTIVNWRKAGEVTVGVLMSPGQPARWAYEPTSLRARSARVGAPAVELAVLSEEFDFMRSCMNQDAALIRLGDAYGLDPRTVQRKLALTGNHLEEVAA